MRPGSKFDVLAQLERSDKLKAALNLADVVVTEQQRYGKEVAIMSWICGYAVGRRKVLKLVHARRPRSFYGIPQGGTRAINKRIVKEWCRTHYAFDKTHDECDAYIMAKWASETAF